MIKIQNIIVDRQCRNKDWNQDLLDDAKVTLVGAGPLANFVATNLVCLNVGNIRIIDNSLYDGNKNEFILARDSKKGKKAKLLEKTLKSMNPYLKIDGIDSKVIDGFALNSDIVVDLTNNIYSKFNSIDFAKKNKVPLILSSTDFTKSIISLYNIEDKEKSLDDLFFKMENKKQGNLTSAFASGFIVEEIRKILHGKESKKDKDNTLKKNIYYYLNKENRFQNGDLIDILNHNFTDKKILMAGAGALGNFFIINSALLGFGNIDVIDMDTIEETNLNRQPLYSFNFPEYVGNKKVNVISNELKKINNKINVRGVYGKLFEQLTKDEIESQVALINEDILDKTNYDLIVGCLDNINTRAKINMYAVKRKIPYIMEVQAHSVVELLYMFLIKLLVLIVS